MTLGRRQILGFVVCAAMVLTWALNALSAGLAAWLAFALSCGLVAALWRRRRSLLPAAAAAGGTVQPKPDSPEIQRSASPCWQALLAVAPGALLSWRRDGTLVHVNRAAAALLARAMTGRPVVFQAQTTGVLSAGNADAALQSLGIAPGRWAGRLLKGSITRLYARADAFACISHDIERETAEAGVDQRRIHFLPNPVDTSHFRPASAGERRELRATWGVTDDRVVVAFAGRLSREKGVAELLEAWRVQIGRAHV